MHSKEFPGNQGKTQIYNASSLPYKFGLIFMRMKEKKNCRKKIQNGHFSKSPILKFFLRKFHRLVLGFIGD